MIVPSIGCWQAMADGQDCGLRQPAEPGATRSTLHRSGLRVEAV